MTQETTPHTTPAAWRETLYLAAINCSHSITHDSIVLHRDPAKDGSALSQMADRLAAEAVPGGAVEQSGSAADERSDHEIMLEWDQHYKSGLTNGTPFLSIVVNFARAAARAAVAGHLAGQSRAAQPAESKITDGDSARSFIAAWHREHFPTDRTFTNYIMGRNRHCALAGDFAWQLAKALESLAPTTSTVSAPLGYISDDAMATLSARSGVLTAIVPRAINGADLAIYAGTVSAPEEVRNLALEDAAKVAEDTDVATREWAMQRYDDGSQTRSDIAAAIRALRTTADKGEAA